MALMSRLAAASFGVLFGSAAMARDLTVVGFGGSLQDAMRATLWQPFSKQAGAPLIDESYTGGIAKIKAMVESGTTNWDVVQMDENEMILACDEGLLEKFDWSPSSRTTEIIPPARSACGVGAFVWSKVLAYDGDRIKDVKGWPDFWDIERWPGKRGLRKEARMTLEIALMADGVPPGRIYDVLSTKEGQDPQSSPHFQKQP